MQQNIFIRLLLIFSSSILCANEHIEHVYRDLSTIETINKELNERLPLFYNHILMGGYLAMPSARMAPSGTAAIGFAHSPPFHIYSVNFQMFSHLEISGNYRILRGVLDSNFGHEGFGNHADRQANVKLALLKARDNNPFLPSFALGIDDFHGSQLFNSLYVVATKEWNDYNLEVTLGWGKKFIHGFFGGAAWSPWRKTDYALLRNLSLIAEWDASDYKKHKQKDPNGLSIKSRFNVGLAADFRDVLQIKVNSFRGNELAASANLHYNLGNTKGFFPKVKDPPYYQSPVNMEPLGSARTKKQLAAEFAHAFSEQGFNLRKMFLVYDEDNAKKLWVKIINVRYRREEDVRVRIEDLLAAITPSDIKRVVVVIEADGIPTQSYHFRTEDLRKYEKSLIPEVELATLSPLREAAPTPTMYDSLLLYNRRKRIWTFTIRPRLITFFGSVKGKFKYTFGFVGGPEGYLFDQIYYRLQAAYNLKTSASDISEMDRLNPSQLPHVRSDSIRYFQSNNAALEQFYLQKGWNLGRRSYFRVATGYFEPAYGGISAEYLYYPVNANWALGFEAAAVLKRRYQGLGFTTKIKKFDGFMPETINDFIGHQYFLDLYYNFKPLNLELKASIGQFLAKDRGARFELTRYYPSGMRFSIWYTLTTANDIVNGSRYQDKGIAFFIPFDFFLKKSSRQMLGYAMSEWLRDVGARSATGKRLYRTLRDERL